MFKKITEPQALYEKAPPAGQVSSSSFTTPPKRPGKLNMKIAGSIVAVCLVAVVGVAGVLIAQRQQNVEGPVAPNAPQSIPQAAIEPTACSVSFVVPGPSTPPAGAADCISKTAVKVVGTTKTALAANAKVAPGDTIEYTVTIGTKADTTRVDIRDSFPTASLEYVPNSAKLDGAAAQVNATEIAKNILVYGYDVASANRGKQNKLTYQVRVKAGIQNVEFTNHADIKFNNNNSLTDSCEINLGVVAAPTGLASCVEKKAFKIDGSTQFSRDGISLIKRGEVITYRVVVKANALTAGDVEVKDVLPATLNFQTGSVTFNGKAATAAQVKLDVPTNTLTFSLGKMYTTATNREITIIYKAAVKETAAIGAIKNAVTVYNAGKAATSPAACSVSVQVAPVGLAVCKSKTASTDYVGGTALAKDSVVQKGSTFVYKLVVEATETTAGKVDIVDTLPSNLEFVESKDSTLSYANGKLTASFDKLGDTAANKTKTFEYKVKVKADAPAGSFSNSVAVTTNGNTAQSDKCSLALQVPYQCDSTCTTDTQCNNGDGNNYVCSTEAGNKCRLASNQGSASCEGSQPTFSCNSSCQSTSDCQKANSNYVCEPTSEGNRCRHKDYTTRASCDAPPSTATPTPTPSIGCNDRCTSNADCTNPSHICYTTGDGSQLCRLDTNPASNTCSNPSTPGTPVAQQPELPQELPQTGPEDWVNWLKAGLITLGVGAALLLLL